MKLLTAFSGMELSFHKVGLEQIEGQCEGQKN